MKQKSKFSFRWSRGEEVLRDPARNKDVAFTLGERCQLGIEGLLPPTVMTLQQQTAMALEQHIGLGALISEAARVTDSMFLPAARALANFTCSQPLAEGSLYPRLSSLREVSRLIGLKVAQTARDEGLGRTLDNEALAKAIDDFCWFPGYP